MKKIPQAVAYILLISALSASDSALAQDQKPTGGRGKSIATPVRAQVEVAALIKEFLKNVNDPAMHDRFWADDLVYTSAKGEVKTKGDIMKSMMEAKKQDKQPEGGASYDAEDIRIRQYGETAVAAFRLVQHEGDKTNYFRNTGTFVNRDGKWQV